jgi:Tetracyclin repressor-like, C-terminal domain
MLTWATTGRTPQDTSSCVVARDGWTPCQASALDLVPVEDLRQPPDAHAGPVVALAVALRQRYEEIFAKVVERGIRSGEFRRLNVNDVVLVLLSTLYLDTTPLAGSAPRLPRGVPHSGMVWSL